jgi:hypothetical protein
MDAPKLKQNFNAFPPVVVSGFRTLPNFLSQLIDKENRTISLLIVPLIFLMPETLNA